MTEQRETAFYSELERIGDLWYWRIRSAGNHEIVLHSEGHARRIDVARLALRLPFPVYELGDAGARTRLTERDL